MIVTDSGGMIEYIDDACALVVSRDEIVKNLTKAIMRAKADDAWRRKASHEGPLRAKNFLKKRSTGTLFLSSKQLLQNEGTAGLKHSSMRDFEREVKSK